jgi:hypothetical protein
LQQSKNPNVTRLESMGSVWRETEDDDSVLLSITNEGVGAMGIMAIENEETISVGFVSRFGDRIEVFLHPEHPELLIGPAIG